MSDESKAPAAILDRLVAALMKEIGYTGQSGHLWWDGERLRFEEIDISLPPSTNAAQAAKRTQPRS